MQHLFAISVVLGVVSIVAADDIKPAAYPDLSDPTAAAFSLGVAVTHGDPRTAKAIYTGTDKEFTTLLDHFVKLKSSADKLGTIVEARFGKSPATLELISPEVDARMGRVPLPTLLATGEVKREGDTAELTCGLVLGVSLKKTGQEWKVTRIECSPVEWKFIFAALDTVAAANEQLAGEVKEGKYHKVYEIYAARYRTLASHVEKLKPQLEKELGVRRSSPVNTFRGSIRLDGITMACVLGPGRDARLAP